jgi:hypothetical protein
VEQAWGVEEEALRLWEQGESVRALRARPIQGWRGRSTIGSSAWERAGLASPWRGEGEAGLVSARVEGWCYRLLLPERAALRSRGFQSGQEASSSEWTWTDRAWREGRTCGRWRTKTGVKPRILADSWSRGKLWWRKGFRVFSGELRVVGVSQKMLGMAGRLPHGFCPISTV